MCDKRQKKSASTLRTPGLTPKASSVDALKRMTSQRQRDTIPEVKLRSALHRMGFRFRVDVVPIAGIKSRADIVFSRIKVAVFVDGCFWHCCPEHGTFPKQNAEWWRNKLASNVSRDLRTNKYLAREGWKVLRIWEHEDPEEAANRVAEVLDQRYSES